MEKSLPRIEMLPITAGPLFHHGLDKNGTEGI
jgi:hypothetical protein